MKTLRWFLLAFVTLGSMPATLFGQAQAANGVIEVVVTDSTSAVVPGAVIQLRNTETGFARNVLSNEVGRGTVPLLPLGMYEIKASAPGFAVVTVENVLLQVGEHRTVEIGLRPSTVVESVTVEGVDVPIVETQRANTSARLDDRAVHNLPVPARNFQTFITLTPGALNVNRGDASSFSVGGQKGMHTGVSIDGADYANTFFGGQIGGSRPPFTISLEAIKEFVVMTNGFNAEFGRSGGGVMNAVTKSGTNSYHGSGFWYMQDRTFIKNDYFNRVPQGRRQQFGGTFGGPIKHDKLFFFVTSDNQRRNSPIYLNFNGLSTLQAAAVSGDPARQDAANAFLGRQGQVIAGDNVWSLLSKVDWLITNKTTLSSRYNIARNRQENGTYGLTGQQAAGPENFGVEVNSVDSWNNQVTTSFTSRLVNEFRYNINREDRPRTMFPTNAPLVNGVPGGATVTINGIGRLGAPGSLPIISLEWRHQFTDNLSYFMGKHEFKFGGEFNNVWFDDGFRGNARGNFTFFTFDSFVAKKPDQYTQFFGPGRAILHPKYPGLFVQDTYKVRPGITINYGLRWDGQTNPTVDQPNTDFLAGTKKIPNDMQQWSPRFGIAWTPGKSGKNVFRYYAAYLYAPMPTLIWANVMFQNGDVTNGFNYFGDRISTPALIPAFNYAYDGPYATPFDSNPSPLAQTTGTVPNGQVNIVDRNFHNPRILRTNVSYERALTRDLTVSTTYDYSFTTGNMRRKDLNLFAPTPNLITGRMTYNRTTRPFQFASNILSREATANARYRALTVAVNKRFSRRFQVQGFYTNAFNRSEDDNENNCCSQDGTDQLNYRQDWGRSNLDVRHNFVANAVIELPLGLEASPILRIQSGRPFNATTGSDDPAAYNLSAAALANFRSYIGKPNAIVFGGGNGDSTSNDRPIIDGVLLARNAFDQPGYFRVDMRVGKTVKFGEAKELKIQVDLFNLFNNSNLFTSNTQINNAAFGALNNADDPFAIQAGMRFSF
ncbi:MAG: TonB dependent receptor [Bryobacterales bacterium]|nr:TonB dependent receptor [Bryobacterales bacterium]